MTMGAPTMKTYDLIAIGTGSAMNIVEAVLQGEPEKKRLLSTRMNRAGYA